MRFSVLIATYNRKEYLRQTIDSVLSQSFPDYELIAIDNGSTDGTLSLLHTYETKIKVISQTNQGPEAAHRTVALAATGEYLAFLDDDDLFLPWTLATYDKIINSLGSPPIILGSMVYLEQGGERTEYTPPSNGIEVLKYPNYFSKDIRIGLSSSKIVVAKSIFSKVTGDGRNSPKKTFPFNDHNLMLQVGMYGPCAIVVRPVTVIYRIHGTNVVNNIEQVARGLLSIMHDIRRERSSESWSRFFAKEAYLGGLVISWTLRALRNRRPWLAFKIILTGWPTIIAAGLKKLWSLSHVPTRITQI